MQASTVKKFNFVRSVIAFSVVLLAGIAFLALFLTLSKPIPENFVETEATITRIEEEESPTYDGTDGFDATDYEYHVFVEYTYGGETYSECEYGNYDSSMKEGDKVLLYVDPDSPTDFMCDPSDNSTFVIVGIVIILVGLGGLVFTIVKKKKGE